MPKDPDLLNAELIDAAGQGSLRIVELSLADGADPKVARDVDGATALMLAAHCGAKRIVEKLLPLSNATATDYLGWNALMAAAGSGSPDCAALLVGHCDALATDTRGRIALDLLPHHADLSEWAFLREATFVAKERQTLGKATRPRPNRGTVGPGRL